MITLTEFLLARIAEDEAAPTCDSWNVYGGIGCPACDRVQADCEARRRIIQRLSELTGNARPQSSLDDEGWELACWETLADLALPYADHPDFREEWRP